MDKGILNIALDVSVGYDGKVHVGSVIDSSFSAVETTEEYVKTLMGVVTINDLSLLEGSLTLPPFTPRIDFLPFDKQYVLIYAGRQYICRTDEKIRGKIIGAGSFFKRNPPLKIGVSLKFSFNLRTGFILLVHIPSEESRFTLRKNLDFSARLLVSVREGRKISQGDLVRSSGVASSIVSKTENGLVKVTAKNLTKLCNTLNVNSRIFFYLYGYEPSLELTESELLKNVELAYVEDTPYTEEHLLTVLNTVITENTTLLTESEKSDTAIYLLDTLKAKKMRVVYNKLVAHILSNSVYGV